MIAILIVKILKIQCSKTKRDVCIWNFMAIFFANCCKFCAIFYDKKTVNIAPTYTYMRDSDRPS